MILVTGATGFVGEHVVQQLLEAGHAVRAMYRDAARQGQHGILSPEQLAAIDWVVGEVNDTIRMEELCVGIDKIYHCAAFISYDPKFRDQMFRTNIAGTATVVNAALYAGVKRLVYVSSIAALGQASEPGMPLDEKASWSGDKRQSNYAISKFRSENEVWRGMEEGLEVCVVNPSVILGPGRVDSGSNQLFRKVYQGLRFYSPGSTGFVDVRDVAGAMVALDTHNLVNERFILNAVNTEYKSLFTKIAEQLNVPAPSICPPRFLANLAWRINKLVAFFNGKHAFITSETVAAAYSTKAFDGRKITNQLEAFRYRPFSATLADGAKAALHYLNK